MKKFFFNASAVVLALLVIVLTVKNVVDLWAAVRSYSVVAELERAAFAAWWGNLLATVAAVGALWALRAEKERKAKIVYYAGLLGMGASVFFGSVAIGVSIDVESYWRAVFLAWFSLLTWVMFPMIVGSCVKSIRYGDQDLREVEED